MTRGTIPAIDPDELGRIRAEAMEFANIGLYRYRFDGTIVFFDRGALRLLDLEERYPDPREIVGKDIGELLEYIDPPGRLRQAMREHGKLRSFEYRYRTLTGKIRWVYHNSYLVADPDTGEEVVQVIAQDITLLKRTVQALASSERRYRALAEHSVQGIGVLQGDEPRLVFVNPALARLLGSSRRELLGAPLTQLLEHVHPDDRDRIVDGYEGVGGFMHTKPEDVRFGRPNAELRWATPTFVPIEYDRRPAVQATFVDTTERRRAEARRRTFEDRMRHAQKLESLGVLAGGIAHDFNNLLAGVLGNAELAALRIDDDQAVSGHLAEIRAASERAAELCRQLLAYSGRHQLRFAPLDLNRLIRDTGALLRVSVSKKAALTYQLQAGLPAVHGDTSQLEQVLMNLIINASEAIGDRPGTISLVTGQGHYGRAQLDAAYAGGERPAGRYLFLEVRDDGAGMDEATRERIFEPFFTTKLTGRGLGLAAVLGIIRGHQGALFVDSAPGRGSTFRVLLPASPEPLAKAGPAADEPAWRGSGAVLVVDDERSIRRVTSAIAEELGYEVLSAGDGREAVDVYRAHADRIRLVLLDVLMPECDGRECFAELRAVRPDLPVVFTSGYGEGAVADVVEREAAVRFLQKPYDLPALRRVLAELLG